MAKQRILRHRQAINCLKRALISADHAQSIICLSLATIHRNLGEEEQAIGYHQKVIDYCRADSEYNFFLRLTD